MPQAVTIGKSSRVWADFMKQNEVVRNWTKDVKQKLVASAGQFTKGKRVMAITYGSSTPITRQGSRTEYKLAPSLKHRVYYRHGISEGAGFQIQRHGVFVHYGVGKGYKRVGGRVVKTGPGPFRRHPVDWFNTIINNNAPILADRVARINADASINFGHMMIK